MDMQRGSMTGSSVGGEKDVDVLNELLRGELSAVETYEQAIDKLDETSAARTQLESCCDLHLERVQRLRELVTQYGGQPSESSGPWGGFAKLIEGSAKLFGEKAAIAALEEGEDHGLRNYRDNLAKLSDPVRSVVGSELMPGQEQTHRSLSQLKHSLH